MGDTRSFQAMCGHCGRRLVIAPLFTAPEIETIRDHLATCTRRERLSKVSPLGEVLTHIWVSVAE